jgi:transcriptional regulator CtsR
MPLFSMNLLFRERGKVLKNGNLIRYSMQFSFLKQLLDKKLITDKEYSLIKNRLMKDYKVVSNLMA